MLHLNDALLHYRHSGLVRFGNDSFQFSHRFVWSGAPRQVHQPPVHPQVSHLAPHAPGGAGLLSKLPSCFDWKTSSDELRPALRLVRGLIMNQDFSPGLERSCRKFRQLLETRCQWDELPVARGKAIDGISKTPLICHPFVISTWKIPSNT